MRPTETRFTDLLQAIDGAWRAESELLVCDEDPNEVLRAVAADALRYNFIVIGEAIKDLMEQDPELVGRHTNVPWSDLAKLRDFLTHGYFKSDIDRVRKFVYEDLPDLAAACIAELGPANDVSWFAGSVSGGHTTT